MVSGFLERKRFFTVSFEEAKLPYLRGKWQIGPSRFYGGAPHVGGMKWSKNERKMGVMGWEVSTGGTHRGRGMRIKGLLGDNPRRVLGDRPANYIFGSKPTPCTGFAYRPWQG